MSTKSSTPEVTPTLSRWMPAFYAVCMALIMLGYVRYSHFQIDGDAVSYMDISSAILHGRWHETVNGYWNPGYPALLAFGKLLTHADRLHELHVFYWVNFFIFLGSIGCTICLVRSLLSIRADEREKSSEEISWAFNSTFVYVTSFSLVFYCWLHEFSLGKIRVDALFASILLVAFSALLRLTFQKSYPSAILCGLFFGLTYWIKSPGFIIALLSFTAFAIFIFTQPILAHAKLRLLLATIVFGIVVAPYITALSLQKGRLDFGDSGALNYVWAVSGSGPQHLLNGQSCRLGSASTHLRHPAKKILANPVVYFFPYFSHATDGPWYDPSYFNDGSRIHFRLRAQVLTWLLQSRRVLVFVIGHSQFLALLFLCWFWGMRIPSQTHATNLLLTLWGIAIFFGCLLLSVHFEDRYFVDLFWIAWIPTLALLSVPHTSKTGHSLTLGAATFLAVSVLILGTQNLMLRRQAVLLSGIQNGWYNPEEFHAAAYLAHNLAPAGAPIACFHACDSDSYWARLASVHITAEIYDTRYMTDASHPGQEWHSLPNKPAVLDSLRAVGIAGIVGRFNTQPAPDPSLTETWQHLAGNYYWLPTQEPEAKISGTQTPVTPQPAAH